MKYEFCEECYFYGVEPAMCDECEDGDQFEPAEADDDAFDRLMELSGPPPKRAKVIMLHPASKQPKAEVEEELELSCA